MESFRKTSPRGGSNGRTRIPTGKKKRASYLSSSAGCGPGSILFWLFVVGAQCYLLKMYHESVLSYSTTGTTTSMTKQNGLERELMRQRMEEFKGTNNINNNNNGRQQSKRQADGSFNGYPIYQIKNNNSNQDKKKKDGFKETTTDFTEQLYSQFHCIGETWKSPQLHKRSKTRHEQPWVYRSCKFEVFCFDTATQEYVIYLDPERHVSSRDDHHYHATVSDPKPHPSPEINLILEAQKARLAKEQKEVDDAKHERNVTTTFKHPTFFDDTSTVYRNHTVVVDGTGKVVLGDTEQEKHYGVSIGSINPKWGLVDIQSLKWFPEVRWGPIPGSERERSNNNSNSNSDDKEYDVYTLPESVVLIPFHSLSAENPGHLVWDDLLPMHTILGMFGFLQTNNNNINNNNNTTESDIRDAVDLLPIRYHLPGDERGLWASCDWLNSKKESCKKMLAKFGTLMGTRRSYLKYHIDEPDTRDPKTSAGKLPRIPITTNRDVQLYLTSQGDPLWGPPPAKLEKQKGDVDDTTRRRFGQEPPNDPSKPEPEKKKNDDDDTARRRFVQELLSIPEPEKKRNDGDDDDTARRRLGEEPPHQHSKSSSSSSSKPKLICARNGLAGFGAISDHVPYKGHGWERWDYEESHNYGRGGKFWEFRNYMIHNLFASFPKTTPTTDVDTRWGHYRQGVTEKLAAKSVLLTTEQLSLYPPHSITDLGPDEPLVVLLSAFSNNRGGGSMEGEINDLRFAIRDMGGAYQALHGRPPTPGDIGARVAILPEVHIFSKYTIEAQIQMASRAAVLVTSCGGGAITAAFLPKGAGLQIYYRERGGIENNRQTRLPARLDWDFFNNAGYLHNNWIPIQAAENVVQKRENTNLLLEQLRRIHVERIKEYQRTQQPQPQQTQ